MSVVCWLLFEYCCLLSVCLFVVCCTHGCFLCCGLLFVVCGLMFVVRRVASLASISFSSVASCML